jgi:hypothetical protein
MVFDASRIGNKYYMCHCCTGYEYIIEELDIPEDHKFYDRPKYKSVEELKEHKKTEEHIDNMKSLYCEDCKVQLTSLETFDSHTEEKEHKRNVKYNKNHNLKCECCDYTAGNKGLLEQHNKTQKHKDRENGIEINSYYCDYCDLHFPHRSKYEIHKQTQKHKDCEAGIVKPTSWECEECKYKTDFKHHYEQHLKSKKHLSKK